MAGEYLETDIDGLGRLALIVDEFHNADDIKLRIDLMREIRLQETRFGLSPIDRSRLHWEVAKGEEAESKRRRNTQQRPSADPGDDPRAGLRAVK